MIIWDPEIHDSIINDPEYKKIPNDAIFIDPDIWTLKDSTRVVLFQERVPFGLDYERRFLNQFEMDFIIGEPK